MQSSFEIDEPVWISNYSIFGQAFSRFRRKFETELSDPL